MVLYLWRGLDKFVQKGLLLCMRLYGIVERLKGGLDKTSGF